MPLINDIEDPKFDRQLNRLDGCNLFICEVAKVVLPGHDGFESVWSITNRVYDRHCSPKARSGNRPGLDELRRTALSA